MKSFYFRIDRMPHRLLLSLAWLQLLVCFAIAAATVYAYSAFGPALRDGIRATAATLSGVADAMERASETIESRRLLISQTAGVLAMAATQIGQLEALASAQATVAPQYAAGLQSASSLLLQLSGTSHAIARALDFEVPSGIAFLGTTPLVTRTRPLVEPARRLDESATQLKNVGTALSIAAVSLAHGAQALDNSIRETSHQSRTLIHELEKTIELVSSRELPNAMRDLKKTSRDLRSLGKVLADVQGLGTFLLLPGLLVSFWCFINSLTTIGLVTAAKRTTAAAMRGTF